VGRIIENPVTGERLTFLATAEHTGGELLKSLPAAATPAGDPGGFALWQRAVRSCISTVTDYAPEGVVHGSDVISLVKVGAESVSTRRR
jgi:hypothetical protein